MTKNQRSENRYLCSEKAVLMTEEGRGNICIIKNISNGGLCLAIVGSAKQPPRSRIAIKLDRGTFVCHIVKRDDKALHCRFDRPIRKIEDANLMTSWPAAYTEASPLL